MDVFKDSKCRQKGEDIVRTSNKRLIVRISNKRLKHLKVHSVGSETVPKQTESSHKEQRNISPPDLQSWSGANTLHLILN